MIIDVSMFICLSTSQFTCDKNNQKHVYVNKYIIYLYTVSDLWLNILLFPFSGCFPFPKGSKSQFRSKIYLSAVFCGIAHLATIWGRQVNTAIFAHGAHIELPRGQNELDTWILLMVTKQQNELNGLDSSPFKISH